MKNDDILNVLSSHINIIRTDLSIDKIISQSQSSVVLLASSGTDKKSYCIKASQNPRVPYSQESYNSALIGQFIPNHTSLAVSHFVSNDIQFLISEFHAHQTLADYFTTNPVRANHYFSQLQDVLLQCWTNHRTVFLHHPNSRCFHSRRIRVSSGIKRFFEISHSNENVADNGLCNKDKYVSILKNAEQYTSTVEFPDFGVLCHGDAHPRNVVANSENWWLIDFEWSGINHDWRLSFAQIYGWWMTEVINTENKYISKFQSNLPISLCENQLSNLSNFFCVMSERNDRYKDILQVKKYIVILFLGYLRRSNADDLTMQLRYIDACCSIMSNNCEYIEMLQNA